MTKKREHRGFTNFGFSTILLSFVMICVVTFSALSLITAHSDYKLSVKVADKTQQYYQACELVYESLENIDRILVDARMTASDKSSYYSALNTLLADYGLLQTTPDGYLLNIKEPVAKDQYLFVQLAIQYPVEPMDSYYEILTWNSVYERELPEDETLNLIQ